MGDKENRSDAARGDGVAQAKAVRRRAIQSPACAEPVGQRMKRDTSRIRVKAG